MAISKWKWWQIVLGVIVALNVILWFSGKFYFYKALAYNYVNIDDLNLFHTRKIAAGKGEPWAIGSDYNKKPLTTELRSALEGYESVAFLVVKDDSIRYEEYWDGYDKSSLSNSFSMAKSIVSILVGIAYDEGKIKSLDQPVCDFLPEFCDGKDKNLTIRHLLVMSSGLDWDEGYTSLFSPTTQAYYDTDLRKQMLHLNVVDEPGKNFDYMSSNTELLAFIVRKATGYTISEYASEKLWKPIGAENEAQWSLDHNDGDEKAYCCFYSNARDFARIGKLFLNNGKWNGKQIVSEEYVRQCITPAPLLDNGKPNTIYGYQWWLTEHQGKKIFYARGILGQYIFVIPDMNLVFVRLGHKRGEKDEDGQLMDTPIYISEIIKMYDSHS
jgi:CubicO group peptidase (beta-lactamase class C family)